MDINNQNATAPTTGGYNPATGYANVDDSVFLADNEGQAEITDNGTSEVTHENAEMKQSGDTDKVENPQAEMFAGKFKSLDDLKSAFAELGGNPAKYSDARALEEAYEVRQSEYTRARQQVAEQERINRQVENISRQPQPEANKTLNPEELLSELKQSGALDKIETPEDLIRVTLEAVTSRLGNLNNGLSHEQVQEIISETKAREERLSELHSLESDIPRLKSDEGFRNLFAIFVKEQRLNGQYQSLRESFKDFVKIGQSVGEEYVNQNKATAEVKQSATSVPDNGAIASGSKDEVDDILGAYNERQSKFN